MSEKERVGMPNLQYQKGRTFEHKVSRWLADRGMAVVRSAGSAGDHKIDLIAFAPDGRVLIIQCKINDGLIAPGEWNRLVEIATWSAGGQLPQPQWRVTVPLVAMRSPVRAKPGAGWAPRFMRLADVKIPRSRTWPWKMYDAVHGRDFDDSSDQG
jgi:hypothetical protein